MLEADRDIPLPNGSYELMERYLGAGGVCASDVYVGMNQPIFQHVLNHPIAREHVLISDVLYRAMGFFPLHTLARWLVYLPESTVVSIAQWAQKNPGSLLKTKLDALEVATQAWSDSFDQRLAVVRERIDNTAYTVRAQIMERLSEMR